MVNDDRDLRQFVRHLLEPVGYVVHEASTAGEAFSVIAAERPVTVLLDVHLPDISGYEVCQRLREEFGDEIAIVFLSGKRTDEVDRTAGLLLGADDYIVKPFATGEFIARIRRMTERAAPARATNDANLTPRELEVLELLADGLDEKKIAQALFIRPKTVATHIQRVLAKLDVHSRAEAVAYVHKNRLFGMGSDGPATADQPPPRASAGSV